MTLTPQLSSCFDRGANDPTSGLEIPGIIDTNYTIPVGAYYVDNTVNGDDSRTALQAQSIGTPWRTLTRAISGAPANSTIILRGAVVGMYSITGIGNYREAAQISINKTLTFQPMPHEQVWIKGSTVYNGGSWTAGAGYWSLPGYNPAFTRGLGSSSSNPLCTEPDMVFYDGQPLTKVATLGAVTTGTFYADLVAQILYIGSNPNFGVVEVCTRAKFAQVSGANVLFRGLGFEHYGTYFDIGGGSSIMQMSGANATIENNTFAYTHASAFSFSQNSNPICRGNLFLHIGMNAGHTYLGQGVLVQGNRFGDINNQRFNSGGVVGVWKVTGTPLAAILEGPTFDYNVVEDAPCNGFWLDVSVHNGTITNNKFLRVGIQGSSETVFMEISDAFICANNLLIDSAELFVSAASNCFLYHNTVVHISRVSGNTLRFFQDHGRERPGQIQGGFLMDRITKLNHVFNNVLFTSGSVTGASRALFRCFDNSPALTGLGHIFVQDQNSNYYGRSSVTTQPEIYNWVEQATVGGAIANRAYTSIAALQAAAALLGWAGARDTTSVSNSASHTTLFTSPSTNNFGVNSGSPADFLGDPLPANVAAALGKSAGIRYKVGVDMAALPPWDGGYVNGAAVLTGVATMVARPSVRGTATLAQQGQLVATGVRKVQGSAALQGVNSLVASSGTKVLASGVAYRRPRIGHAEQFIRNQSSSATNWPSLTRVMQFNASEAKPYVPLVSDLIQFANATNGAVQAGSGTAWSSYVSTFNNYSDVDARIAALAARFVRIHGESSKPILMGDQYKGASLTTLAEKLSAAGIKTSNYGHGSYVEQNWFEEAAQLEATAPLAIAVFDDAKTLQAQIASDPSLVTPTLTVNVTSAALGALFTSSKAPVSRTTYSDSSASCVTWFRIDDEIFGITSVGALTSGYYPVSVRRAMFGTTPALHTVSTKVYFPCYLGTATSDPNSPAGYPKTGTAVPLRYALAMEQSNTCQGTTIATQHNAAKWIMRRRIMTHEESEIAANIGSITIPHDTQDASWATIETTHVPPGNLGGHTHLYFDITAPVTFYNIGGMSGTALVAKTPTSLMGVPGAISAGAIMNAAAIAVVHAKKFTDFKNYLTTCGYVGIKLVGNTLGASSSVATNGNRNALLYGAVDLDEAIFEFEFIDPLTSTGQSPAYIEQVAQLFTIVATPPPAKVTLWAKGDGFTTNEGAARDFQTRSQYRRFVYAHLLMAIRSQGSAFQFMSDWGLYAGGIENELLTKLGNPIGAPDFLGDTGITTLSPGVYLRRFTEGFVCLNTTGNTVSNLIIDNEALTLGPLDAVLRGSNWYAVGNCWTDDVNMIVDSEAVGARLICQTKLWPNTNNTLASSKQWHRLSLGSFLLGANGLTHFTFRHDNPNAPAGYLMDKGVWISGLNYAIGMSVTYGGGVRYYCLADHLSSSLNAPDLDSTKWVLGASVTQSFSDYATDNSALSAITQSMSGRHSQQARFYYGDGGESWWNNVRIGTPIAAGASVSSVPNYQSKVWARQFTSGWVFVNPTVTDQIITLPIGDSFVDIDGTRYLKTAKVPAYSSLILSVIPVAWGTYREPSSYTSGALDTYTTRRDLLATGETQFGRKFDVERCFLKWEDLIIGGGGGTTATADYVELVASQGRIPWINLVNERRSGSTAPSWAAIGSGAEDAYLDALAARLNSWRDSTGSGAFFCFHHEPESRLNAYGVHTTDSTHFGDSDDYKAAWARIRARFNLAGVTNLTYVFDAGCLQWNTGTPGSNFKHPANTCPPDTVIDWVAANPFNFIYTSPPANYNSWATFASLIDSGANGFYQWTAANRSGLPIMVGAMGCIEDPGNPTRRGSWLAAASASIRNTLTRLRGAIYFDASHDTANKTVSSDWMIADVASVAGTTTTQDADGTSSTAAYIQFGKDLGWSQPLSEMLDSAMQRCRIHPVSGLEIPSIIETAYPIPVGAYYVDPVNGDDTRSSTQAQSILTPWKTLTKAVQSSAVLANSTIILRGARDGTYTRTGPGNYREPRISGTINAASKNGLTIQPYPHEQVWIKGSVIKTASNFVLSSGKWVLSGYTPDFVRGQGTSSSLGVVVEEPDMVFIDGRALTQVLSLGAVIANTFYVDTVANTLTLGTDPASGVVEICMEKKYAQFASADVTIRGIGFEHWGCEFNGNGLANVVGMSGARPKFQNNTVAWVHGGQGISISQTSAPNNVTGNLFLYMGQNAGHTYLGQTLNVVRNRFTGINWNQFDSAGVVAVWKATGGENLSGLSPISTAALKDALFASNIIEDATCNGLWADVSIYNITIVSNRFDRVGRGGGTGGSIFFEISAKGIFANNLMVNCDAIMLSAVSDADTWHNTLVKTGSIVSAGSRLSPAEHYSDAHIRFYQDQARERTTGYIQNGVMIDRITKLNRLYNNVMHTPDSSSAPALVRLFDSNDSVILAANATSNTTNTLFTLSNGHTFNGSIDLSANQPDGTIEIVSVGTLVPGDAGQTVSGAGLTGSVLIDHVTVDNGQTFIADQDYNFYGRFNAGAKPNVFTWLDAGASVNYASLSAFISAASSGGWSGDREANSVDSALAATGVFVDPANGDFSVLGGSTADILGKALPTNVATALGRVAGTRYKIGADLNAVPSVSVTRSTTGIARSTSVLLLDDFDFMHFGTFKHGVTQLVIEEKARGTAIGTTVLQSAFSRVIPRGSGSGYSDARMVQARAIKSDIEFYGYDLPGGVDDKYPGEDTNHPPEVFVYATATPPVGATAQVDNAYCTVPDTTDKFKSTFIMALYSTKWRDFLELRYAKSLGWMASATFDGVEMDVMGAFPTVNPKRNIDSATSPKPWNPFKGDNSWFVPSEWLAISLEAISRVVTAASKFVMVNGIENGTAYFVPNEGETKNLLVHTGVNEPHGELFASGSAFSGSTACVMSGTGAIVAAGTARRKAASTTLAGVGSLSANGRAKKTGAASLVGLNNVVALGIQRASEGATLVGVNGLVATGDVTTEGIATLSGLGALLANGTIVTSSNSATLTGVGTLTVVGHQRFSGAATLGGVNAVSAAGVARRRSSASLAGVNGLVATGKRKVFSQANSLSGRGALVATASHKAFGAATLTGVSTLSTSGTSARKIGSATLSGQGALSGATGSLTVKAQMASFVAGVMVANGQARHLGQTTLSGRGALVALPLRKVKGTAFLSGDASAVVLRGYVSSRGTATLRGTSLLQAAGLQRAFASSTLHGSGTLSATSQAFGVHRGIASCSGRGALIINGSIIHRRGEARLVGRGRLVANISTVKTIGRARLRGRGHLRARVNRLSVTPAVKTFGSSATIVLDPVLPKIKVDGPTELDVPQQVTYRITSDSPLTDLHVTFKDAIGIEHEIGTEYLGGPET